MRAATLAEANARAGDHALLARTADGWHVTLRAVAYDWKAAVQRAEQEGRPDRAGAFRTGFVTRLEGAA